MVIYIYKKLAINAIVRPPLPLTEANQDRGVFLIASVNSKISNYDTEYSKLHLFPYQH